MTEQLAAEIPEKAKNYVCVPIHGPDVSARTIMEYLLPSLQGPTDPHLQLIHFDISHSVCRVGDSIFIIIDNYLNLLSRWFIW